MNRRIAFWSLTIVVTVALAGAPAVRAATYFVRALGDDRKEGTTPQAAFRTVTRAAQALAHGDRIVIGPGQYREAVLISERFGTPEAPLAVVGDESGKLTGDAPGAVVVEPAIFGEPALYIHRSQHVQVSGLTFRGRGVGLQVEKVRGLAIERCTFDGLSKGLAVALSDDLRLQSAVIARCITGAQVKQTTRSRLAHLTVASCSAVGVLVSTSAGGEICNSIFADNGTAMVVDPASASSWSSDHNAIAGTVGSWGLAGQCRIIYEWFSSSGQERHSTYTLPAFASPVVEGPAPDDDGTLAHMSSATLLGGRPYLMAGGQRRLPPDEKGNARRQSGYFLLDVAKPLEPRVTGFAPLGAAYRDVRFAKNGDIVLGIGGPEELKFAVYPFGGFQADGKPIYDFAKPVTRDCGKDTSSTGLRTQFGLAVDPQTNDYYIMALSAQHKKTVPTWGASGSGLAKLDAGGKLKWFSLTSGGNFTGTAMLRDKNEAWAFIAKDFGGQVDVFNSDGLRLATLNWGWPANWTCGFVDMRDGLTAYRRPDGKPGVYVEDDSIGRLMRGRLDGAETRKKMAAGFTWAAGATAGPAPLPNVTGGPGLQNPLSLPKVAPLPVDGDWNAWAAAGVTPQCVMLPLVGWGYTWPRDLLETFRAGTGGAAFAHDGKNLYCCFLVTDDTPIFGDNPAIMFSFDGVEFWVEEEQFGLGLLAGGKPALFKYRYHNRAGAEWSAGYKLDDANVWGKMIPDAGAHPLGRYLGNVLGTSLDGKSAYVLMGRIPLEEIKLVGGIAGRKGGEIRATTAGPGELIRLGVAISGMSAWGRAQDYKVTT